jgi:hypothetical protein
MSTIVMCGITVPIVGDTDRSSDELAGVSIFFFDVESFIRRYPQTIRLNSSRLLVDLGA